jgi:hypothetical protein
MDQSTTITLLVGLVGVIGGSASTFGASFSAIRYAQSKADRAEAKKKHMEDLP